MNVWPNASPPTSVTGVAEWRKAGRLCAPNTIAMNGISSKKIPIDAAVTTARPTSFFEPRTSSAKLIPLSYPFTENNAVASAVTIRLTPIADTPVVPVGPTGWLRIDHGWCQWLNPATASAPTTISSIARQTPVNQALNLIFSRHTSVTRIIPKPETSLVEMPESSACT